MPDTRPCIGIDLGGTNIQVGVVEPDGAVRSQAKRKTRASEGPDAVLDRIASGVDEACAQAGVDPARLAAVGVGAPGVVDPRTGDVVIAVNLGWRDFPLATRLRERFRVPVVVENDVRSAVWGEHQVGAGERSRNMLGVWLGTGVGGGLILGGRLHHGSFHSAGEIGHTILFPAGGPGHRTVEDICSRTAVGERLARLAAAGHQTSIGEHANLEKGPPKSKAIAAALAADDPLTRRVVDHVAHLLGIVAANAITLLSLDRVVFGGGLAEAVGEPLIESIRASCDAHVFPDKARDARIVLTALRDNAGVVGAAMLARESA